MRRNLVYAVLIVGLFALAIGCSKEKSDDDTDSSPLSPAQGSPLLGPTAAPSVASPPILPQPARGLATVSGKFVLQLDESPIVGATIYLGVVDETEGDIAVARLDTEAAPQTTTDEAGRFVFTDISPGRYALIYATPLDTYLARTPDGEDVVFVVGPDEIKDLGTMLTPFLGQ